jgi:hypothetical protein
MPTPISPNPTLKANIRASSVSELGLCLDRDRGSGDLLTAGLTPRTSTPILGRTRGKPWVFSRAYWFYYRIPDLTTLYINRCITSSRTERLGLTRSSGNVPRGSSTRFSISVKLGFCVST